MSSAEFYDDFISYQIKSGINDRIYQLYKRLSKSGITTNSNILEIGCGIGIMTYLISRKVRQGRIEALDISSKSIAFARTKLKRPNVFFYDASIFDFEPGRSTFDYLLLFDVIEHIPVTDHVVLFRRISEWMTTDSTILVNIPNPEYTLFDSKYNPQALQEIDQPVFIDNLTRVLSETGLWLKHFETYSVWVRNDYQFLVIKKKFEFKELSLHSERSLIQKIKMRIAREIRRLKYRYTEN